MNLTTPTSSSEEEHSYQLSDRPSSIELLSEENNKQYATSNLDGFVETKNYDHYSSSENQSVRQLIKQKFTETNAAFQYSPSDRRGNRRLVKQRFEGVVTTVNGDEFIAEIHDLDNPNNPIEIVTLLIDEVPNNDKYLIVSGSVFNWYIGTIIERNFQHACEPYSKIAFRRLPPRTTDDFERARKEAEEFVKKLNQID